MSVTLPEGPTRWMGPRLADTQRRYATTFRIRAGVRDARGRPVRLDRWRVTSPSARIIEAITDVYGGEVCEWPDAPGGPAWQAILESAELAVMVLPGASLSQHWERWSGGGCDRRCDGRWDEITGSACDCPALPARMGATGACRPTSRLSVVLPDVRVLGAGRLDSHGMIAAETLPASVRLAQELLARGSLVPAILRLCQRTTGRRQFCWPQLELTGTSLAEITAARGPAELPPGQAGVPDTQPDRESPAAP